MNRKQKVAVVVGVVVVVLLVLLPPYQPPERDGTTGHRWLHAWTPATTRQWIGTDRPVRLAQRDEKYVGFVDPRGHWSGMIPSWYEEVEQPDGSITEVAHWEPRWREEKGTRTVTTGIPFTLAVTELAVSIAATLALTVAAVVVLKEGRP